MKKWIHDFKEGRHLIRTSAVVLGVLFLLLSGPAWNIYVDVMDLEPGGIGSEAQDDTPIARSIADMEALERFTILEARTDYADFEYVWLADEIYYIVTLDSGERIAVKNNYNNATLLYEDGVEGYLYRYAIGTWRPWKLDQEALREAEQIEPKLTRTDYYADMAGHQLTAWTEVQFRAGLFTICQVIALIFLISYGAWREKRQEKKEKERQDASLPRNDLERWLAGTYAIWGQFFAQVVTAAGKMAWDDNIENGPIHFGGRPKDEASEKLTRETLSDSWDIKNQRDLLETVEYMSAGPGLRQCSGQAGRAWELCRSMQLLGMGYIAGWYSREEMVRRSCEVGKTMQNTFRSWEELCEGFLEGYANWRFRAYPQQAQKDLQVRRDIYNGLQRRQDSPYRINWYLPLDPDEWARREKRRQEVERQLGNR